MGRSYKISDFQVVPVSPECSAEMEVSSNWVKVDSPGKDLLMFPSPINWLHIFWSYVLDL